MQVVFLYTPDGVWEEKGLFVWLSFDQQQRGRALTVPQSISPAEEIVSLHIFPS